MATSDYKALGTTGLNRQGGRIYNEHLRELQGSRWRRVVPQMQTDDTVGAILWVAKMLIRQAERKLEAADADTNGDVQAFVEECFDDMRSTWSSILSEILTMMPWGFAPLVFTAKRRRGMNPGFSTDSDTGEKKMLPTSKYDDGRVGWSDWSIRSQDTVDEWTWSSDDVLTGFWQVAPPKYERVWIPIERVLLFRPESNRDNPEGESIIRNAYDSWYYKRNFMRAEGIFAERLSGLPLAEVPPNLLTSNATSDEKAILSAIENIVTNVKIDEQMGIVWPLAYDENSNPLYRFSLLTSGGQPYDFDRSIMRYSRNIATTIGAQFLYLGQGDTGSWALSSDQTNLFSTGLSSLMRSIEDVINRDAIPPLLRWNGIPIEMAPKFKLGDIERISMTELADYIQKLTGANVILPDEELEKHVRQQADLPEASAPRKPPQTAMPQPTMGDGQAPTADGGSMARDGEQPTKDDQVMAAREFSEAALLQGAARILARGW